MKCPLCGTRQAKRQCPAKASKICAICCGTKREVEIDCPSDCAYLRSGREYESEKLARTMPLPHHTARLWENTFLVRYQATLMAASRIVTDTRQTSPDVTDHDLLAAIESLIQTFETLDKGIYYESPPSARSPRNLYENLKAFLGGPADPKMIAEHRLTPSEVIDCLQFLKELSWTIVLPRPKSRAFLDHLEGVAGSSHGISQQSRLILPAGF